MRFFIVLMIQLSSVAGYTQSEVRPEILKEIGFWPGFGYGNSTKSLPEGNYQPYYCLAHIAFWPFRNTEKTSAGQRFRFYLEPQWNYVELVSDSGVSKAHEFGLNIGAKYIYPLSKTFDLFIYISTGPHSYSATTSRQAPGYLFSDNMGIGTYCHFSERLAGVFTFRIRHLSNADTRKPNFGINNDNFHLGISYFISKQ